MVEIPEGKITTVDIFNKLTGIEVKLANVDSLSTDVSDHETRIRSLEAFKYKLYGAVFLAACVAGAISGWVSAVVRK